MSTNSQITTRPASIRDKDFILSLVPRLIEFGPPSWRDINGMTNMDIQILTDKLLNEDPDTYIFIAENENNMPLGFIHIQTGSDYYNKVKHGHISDIIVAPGAEGHGIGRILMSKAEEWARTQEFRWLTLSVFAQNVRARELYKNLGYGEDIMKYVKVLN